MPLFIYLCFAFCAGLIVGRTEMLRSLGMTWTDYFHRLKH